MAGLAPFQSCPARFEPRRRGGCNEGAAPLAWGQQRGASSERYRNATYDTDREELSAADPGGTQHVRVTESKCRAARRRGCAPRWPPRHPTKAATVAARDRMGMLWPTAGRIQTRHGSGNVTWRPVRALRCTASVNSMYARPVSKLGSGCPPVRTAAMKSCSIVHEVSRSAGRFNVWSS